MSKEFPFYIIIKKWGKNVHVMTGKISIIYNIKAFIDVITVFIVVGRKLLRTHFYRKWCKKYLYSFITVTSDINWSRSKLLERHILLK